jgi:hypothetical protein
LTGELSNGGPSGELDARISPDLSFVNVAVSASTAVETALCIASVYSAVVVVEAVSAVVSYAAASHLMQRKSITLLPS